MHRTAGLEIAHLMERDVEVVDDLRSAHTSTAQLGTEEAAEVDVVFTLDEIALCDAGVGQCPDHLIPDRIVAGSDTGAEAYLDEISRNPVL